VTVLLCTFVDVLVTVTVTPGITAPLGSVTVPEIEPVMPAQATAALNRTAAATPKFKTDFLCLVTVEAPCSCKDAQPQLVSSLDSVTTLACARQHPESVNQSGE
jgi:hypothetical protein